MNSASRSIRFELTRLPDAFRGMRIVQISDFHYAEYTEPFFLREMVRRDKPAAPGHGGADRRLHQFSPLPSSFARRFAPGCASILSGIECPLRYASLGNHDYYIGPQLRHRRRCARAWHSGADEFRCRAGAGRAARYGWPVWAAFARTSADPARAIPRAVAKRTGDSAGARAGHPARYRALQRRPDALRAHARRPGTDSLSAAAASAQIWPSGMSRACSAMVPRSCT